MTSLNILFFDWWYKEGYAKITAYFKRYFVYLYDQFSVSICLKTLFDVWRRDYVNTDNMSLQEKFQAFVMNLASRFIGMMIKLMTIFVFLIFALLSLIVIGLCLIIWTLYPLVILTLIIFGFHFIFTIS